MSSDPNRHFDADSQDIGPTIDLTNRSSSRPVADGPLAKEVTDLLAPPQSPGELGQLGHFRVLNILGAGGMGIVLAGQDVLLGRPAALKVMRRSLADDPVAVERFLREARAAAGVRHRHVVTVYEVGLDRGVPFLAMELLRGAALDERLKSGQQFSLPEAVRIGRQAADGLAAAHAGGLIHRDVKPSNIWLESPRGDVKFLDFGLARLAQDDLQLTRTGAVVGSPHYMAPEQARGSEVDFRCDLFSLGCVLYELVTGRKPFPGVSLTAVLTALAVDSPAPAESLNRDIPLPLAELIKQLMAKDPADRPGSASEVAQRLAVIEQSLSDPLQGSLGSSTRQLIPPLVPGAAQAGGSRGTGRFLRRWAWIIAPTVLLALALAASWGTWLGGLGGQPKGATANRPPSSGPTGAVPKSAPKPRKSALTPLDPQWESTVRNLTPNQGQLEEVLKELARRNPGFGDKPDEVGVHKAPDNPDPVAFAGLKISADNLQDLSPLRVLTRLDNFNCYGTAGDRSPLEDLSPLSQLPLRDLHVPHTSVSDLTPLAGMPLEFLDVSHTPVSDLTPIQERRLNSLHLRGTAVRDLGPLTRMPLKVLDIREIPATDFRPLTGMPIEEIYLDYDPGLHARMLQSLARLEKVNGQPVEQFHQAAAGAD